MAAFADRKDYPELSALLRLEDAHKFDLQARKALMEYLDQRNISVPPGFLVFWHINDGRKRPYCTLHNHLAGKGCSKGDDCGMTHRCLVCNEAHGMWFRDGTGRPKCSRLARLQAEMERLGERALVTMDAWRVTSGSSPESSSRRCSSNLSQIYIRPSTSPEPSKTHKLPEREILGPDKEPVSRPAPEPVRLPVPEPVRLPVPEPVRLPAPKPPVAPPASPIGRPRPIAILPRPPQPQLMLVEVPTAAFLDFISQYQPEYVRTGSGAASVDSKTVISAISYI